MTVRVLTDEESDAMRTAIPIVGARQLGEGDAKWTLPCRPNWGTKRWPSMFPDDADPRKTRVAVSLSPTPASAAFEAIPYLAGYPYGCVEQTMSRFYPTVLAAKTLKQLGIDVEQLVQRSRARRPLARPDRTAGEFLDAAELERMTEAGLQRLARFQHNDGGWGWWEHDPSSPYMTAYVLIGLHVAAECGAKVDENGFDRGLSYLAKLDDPAKSDGFGASSDGARHTGMLVTYALSLARPASFHEQDANARTEIQRAFATHLDAAFKKREQLPTYDRLLLRWPCRISRRRTGP